MLAAPIAGAIEVMTSSLLDNGKILVCGGKEMAEGVREAIEAQGAEDHRERHADDRAIDHDQRQPGGQDPQADPASPIGARLIDGTARKLADEFFKPYKVVAVPCGNTGTQMGGWFRKEIKTVADLSGLKMRIGGIAGQVLQKVGVVPQQLAGGDIYPALEKGTIDAAEWVGPYDDEKLGFVKVAKYYYYPGFWEGGPTVHAFANLEKFNALPKNYQAIFTNACAHANTWMAARYDMQNPTALKRLVASGTQLRPFTNEVLEACLKATNELWSEISGKNADFKKSIDAMQAYRSDEYLWWQVAEYTYDSFMIRSRTRG